LTLRREVMAVAVREAMARCGYKRDAVVPSFTPVKDQDGQVRYQVKLLLRDCNAEAISQMISLETAIRRRAATVDPMSKDWMSAIVWQFEFDAQRQAEVARELSEALARFRGEGPTQAVPAPVAADPLAELNSMFAEHDMLYVAQKIDFQNTEPMTGGE
jgi:hypothetical protein